MSKARTERNGRSQDPMCSREGGRGWKRGGEAKGAGKFLEKKEHPFTFLSGTNNPKCRSFVAPPRRG